MTNKTNEPDIIFILGIMPRSGTHFLWNLLALHPDCEKSAVPEDGLVSKSDMLARYVNLNYHVWQSEGDLPAIPARQLLFESLGEGLKLFLRRARAAADQLTGEPAKQARYIVTKFPQVTHIDKFFGLFPQQKLLILVRDGRALVESINKSFRYDREEAIRDWALAARRIAAFEKKWPEAKGKQYLVVQYETLYTNTEPELRRILDFLGLDAGRYDFAAAPDLPVVGSSVFKRGEGDVHWNPVSKTDDFNPLARTAGWTRRQHERFNWLAGKELVLSGYQPQAFAGSRTYWSLWNRLLDTGYSARVWFRRFRNLWWRIERRTRNYFKRKGS